MVPYAVKTDRKRGELDLKLLSEPHVAAQLPAGSFWRLLISVFALTIWMDLTLIAVVLVFAVMLTLVAARQGAAGAMEGAKESQTEASGEKRMLPGNFGIAVFPWFVGIFLLANLLADVPFLISVYGFGRVWNERLYFVEKVHGGGPWFVSNGDRLVDGLYIQYLFAMAIFAGLIVVSLFLAGRYLTRK